MLVIIGWWLLCNRLTNLRPIPLLWNVKLNRNAKVSVAAILGLGILYVCTNWVAVVLQLLIEVAVHHYQLAYGSSTR